MRGRFPLNMEWEKHHQDEVQNQQALQLQRPHHHEPHRVQRILLGVPPPPPPSPSPPPSPPLSATSGGGGGGGGGAAFVGVMTDEQMEALRKQIAAYATISEQLDNLHRSLTSNSHNDPNRDCLLRNLANPLMGQSPARNHHNHNHNHNYHHHHNQYYYYGQPKIPRRQRWNPTPEQLRVLEQIFDQGNEAPSKERIKNITAELTKHGQIAERNVYNWFQNRRARFKKKHMMMSTISESEGEMAVDEASPNSAGENRKSPEQPITINGNQTQQLPEPVFTEDSSTATGVGSGGGSDGSVGHVAGTVLSLKTKLDYLAANSESYYPYIQEENYQSIE